MQLRGYWRAAKDYWHTPKGHHDILDYGRAILIIIGVMAGAMLLVRTVCER